jgi:lipoprotein-anchoring transpeptidase ErfK/SrfK
VFRSGEAWGSTRVSTGRRGHETPVGTFPILQKKVHHRSNLYDNAPMPYMQRLTWGGVALHAGRVPGYPASHGCIRLPRAFAQDLYRITGFSTTTVVVTDEPATSAEEARALI